MTARNLTPDHISANEEIRRVPADWIVKILGPNRRVIFYHNSDPMLTLGTYTHPVLGDLPWNWELCRFTIGFVYYNKETGEQTTRGPRVLRRQLNPPLLPPAALFRPTKDTTPIIPGAAKAPAPDLFVPPDSVAVSTNGPGKLIRNGISTKPLNGTIYERIKVIDDGQGDLGGMNGGVYVVRKKSTGRLFVEKVFKSNNSILIKAAKDEIRFIKSLIHNSLVHYVDAYVRLDPFEASAYMEFCDRGSLQDILDVYKCKKKACEPDMVPESFVWHAFLGLADGLYFLQTGQSYPSLPLCDNDPAKWRPVLHRDLKPDNILLRSRDTPGSKKPLYVLMSDFGLAAYDKPDAPEQLHAMCGTPEYHAPELCFSPEPDTTQGTYQAAPHSGRSDVWALACLMHALCERDGFAHLDRGCFPLRSLAALGRRAKKPVLAITEKVFYSDYLESVIAWAGAQDPDARPDATQLVAQVQTTFDQWCANPLWQLQVAEGGVLPDWAPKKSNLV